MGFPARLLNPGEEVVVCARPHWKFLFGPVTTALVALAGSVSSLVYAVPRWAEVLVGCVLVVCLVWLAGRYVRWATTLFVVTTERLVVRSGVVRRSSREILVDRLTDISCSQSLVDRLLRCGDLLIESPGRDSPEVFHDLARPAVVQSEIYRVVNARRATLASMAGTGIPWLGASGGGPGTAGTTGAAGPAGPADHTVPAAPRQGAPSVADQLSQLDDLRRRGVISRREFAAKKAELLSRM
jgi:membrane protein YdbS with pleckstrin-like domain